MEESRDPYRKHGPTVTASHSTLQGHCSVSVIAGAMVSALSLGIERVLASYYQPPASLYFSSSQEASITAGPAAKPLIRMIYSFPTQNPFSAFLLIGTL